VANENKKKPPEPIETEPLIKPLWQIKTAAPFNGIHTPTGLRFFDGVAKTDDPIVAIAAHEHGLDVIDLAAKELKRRPRQRRSKRRAGRAQWQKADPNGVTDHAVEQHTACGDRS
jgi:hypothetical protein